MSARAQIRRPGLVSFAIKVGGVGFGLVTAVVLARVLGAPGYGEYSYVLALVMLVAIPAQLGLPNLVVRETARAQAAGEGARMLALWGWVQRVVAVISVLSMAALVAFFFVALRDRVRFETLLWALPLLPLIALGNLRGGALRGLGRVNLGQLPEVLLRPAFLLAFLLVAVLIAPAALTPARAMQFHVLGAALAFGLGALWLARHRPRGISPARPTAQERRLWLKSAAILGAVSGLQVFNANADLVMLGLFRDTATVGVYKVAASIATSASFMLAALSVVIMPQVVTLIESRRTRALQTLVTRTTRRSFAAAAAIFAGFALLGGVFLERAFGAEFAASYPPMVVLLASQTIGAFFGPVSMVLNMAGLERVTLGGVAVGAGVNVVANLALIAPFGALGAATASLLSLAIWNVLLARSARRHLGLRAGPLGGRGA